MDYGWKLLQIKVIFMYFRNFLILTQVLADLLAVVVFSHIHELKYEDEGEERRMASVKLFSLLGGRE
jgi:hypothetical protein